MLTLLFLSVATKMYKLP